MPVPIFILHSSSPVPVCSCEIHQETASSGDPSTAQPSPACQAVPRGHLYAPRRARRGLEGNEIYYHERQLHLEHCKL